MLTPKQQEALDLQASGLTLKQIAERRGVSESAIENMLARARATMRRLDPAIVDAQKAVNTNLTPALVWAKTKNEDGTSYSALLKPEEDQGEQQDAFLELLEGIKPAEPIAPPKTVSRDWMTLYPLPDVHLGMMSWGQETGEDYDTKIAVQRLKDGMSKCVSFAPDSECATILVMGDFLHANDDSNQTPASKHPLDTDSRHWKTTEAAIQVLIELVSAALQKHRHVIVRLLRGNHDPEAYKTLTFALWAWFRDNDRVEVEKSPCEFWVQEFGNNMFIAQHGDRAKPQQVILEMADRWPEMWARTRNRFYLSGHKHSAESKRIGGALWMQFDAICSRDAYAAGYPFTSRSAMSVISVPRNEGQMLKCDFTF